MITRILKGEGKIPDSSDSWLSHKTLGIKSRSFLWQVDDSLALHISSEYKNSCVRTVSIISADELDHLDRFMQGIVWADLANDSEKLGNGSEKGGIGRFLYMRLGWDGVDVQIAGPLSAVFVSSGVWEYNGLRKEMKFRRAGGNWRSQVGAYYQQMRCLNADLCTTYKLG